VLTKSLAHDAARDSAQEAAATTSGPKTPPPGATYAVAILTAMNLLNYADRYVPSAIKELYKRDLHLSDMQTSLPLTAFVIVYIIASPIFGALADRFSRKKLIAIGVAAWSLATASAAAATGFASFFVARAAVGIGEAAYATLAPPLLSDFYPPKRRNRVLTFFYLAIPLGAALGYTAGAWLGKSFGWRSAFLVAGVPGLLVAAAALKIKEPPRGYYDKQKREHKTSWPKALKAFGKNYNFLSAVAGYTAVMFAAGAISDWFPTFLQRERGFDLAQAGTIVGIVTVSCGIAGTAAGSFAADKLVGKVSHPYLAFSGLAMIPATLCASLTLIVPGKVAAVTFLAIGQFFAWSYNGPINALIVNSVPSPLRTRAISLSVLATHLFGDALSPTIVGFMSDRSDSLRVAMWAAPIAMAVGTAIWLVSWRLLSEADQD
jgi:MFS family permease